MLVYQASRPFRGKMRSQLTYDVLNPKTVAKFFRTAKPNLIELLAAAEARLRRNDELAKDYEQRKLPVVIQAAQKWNKSRKCLYLLIRAESGLVDAVVELGGVGRLAPKQQARKISAFEKKWRFQLRRLCPGADFTWLAPDLFEAATCMYIARNAAGPSDVCAGLRNRCRLRTAPTRSPESRSRVIPMSFTCAGIPAHVRRSRTGS